MEQVRPKCKLTGTDGNVFALLGRARKTLKKAGQHDKAKELAERLVKCHSYHEAIALIDKYVEIC